MKIVLATGNAHKLKEIGEILSPHNIEVIGLKELNINIDDVVENGTTYSENALIKARAVALKTSLPVISDDSGMEVKAMDNKPGIYSARFASSLGGHSAANKVIIENVKGKDRSARFICDIALVNFKEEKIFEGITTGTIAEEPEGNNGFGYDPIFICDDLNKNYALLTDEEKNKVSHRSKALEKLIDYLKKENVAI